MKKSDNKVINLFEQSSIGTKALVITESLKMKRGGSLTRPVLAYETWGKLSKSKDNVIVILTGLSANSHVTSNSSHIRQKELKQDRVNLLSGQQIGLMHIMV